MLVKNGRLCTSASPASVLLPGEDRGISLIHMSSGLERVFDVSTASSEVLAALGVRELLPATGDADPDDRDCFAVRLGVPSCTVFSSLFRKSPAGTPEDCAPDTDRRPFASRTDFGSSVDSSASPTGTL